MQKSNKTLLFFTAEFPYGNKSETFIETEIRYLSQHFFRVIVFPSVQSEIIRKVPDNVFVDNSCVNVVLSKKKKIRVLFFHFITIIQLLISEIRSKGFIKVWKGKRILTDYIAGQLYYVSILAPMLRQHIADSVCYSYWFCDKLLALSLIKRKNLSMKLVCRAHGYDLYDDRWPVTGVPLRNFKLKYIDHCFLISQFGLNYLKRQIGQKYHHKLSVSKLGVHKIRKEQVITETGQKVLVSCASLIPLKRVHLIAEIIKDCSLRIKWVHFGDGPGMDLLKKHVGDLPSSVEVEIKGHLDNNEVLNYYATQKVDLLVSVSESEGLPVSMMEALSFGIPVLAVPVGGVPEIVVDGVSGFLFPEHYDLEEYRLMLAKTLNFKFDSGKIIDYFDSNFNAKINYTIFVSEISNISQ
jgi:glycosyltransferase involved in cell wall biosynthesis